MSVNGFVFTSLFESCDNLATCPGCAPCPGCMDIFNHSVPHTIMFGLINHLKTCAGCLYVDGRNWGGYNDFSFSSGPLKPFSVTPRGVLCVGQCSHGVITMPNGGISSARGQLLPSFWFSSETGQNNATRHSVCADGGGRFVLCSLWACWPIRGGWWTRRLQCICMKNQHVWNRVAYSIKNTSSSRVYKVHFWQFSNVTLIKSS